MSRDYTFNAVLPRVIPELRAANEALIAGTKTLADLISDSTTNPLGNTLAWFNQLVDLGPANYSKSGQVSLVEHNLSFANFLKVQDSIERLTRAPEAADTNKEKFIQTLIDNLETLEQYPIEQINYPIKTGSEFGRKLALYYAVNVDPKTQGLAINPQTEFTVLNRTEEDIQGILNGEFVSSNNKSVKVQPTAIALAQYLSSEGADIQKVLEHSNKATVAKALAELYPSVNFINDQIVQSRLRDKTEAIFRVINAEYFAAQVRPWFMENLTSFDLETRRMVLKALGADVQARLTPELIKGLKLEDFLTTIPKSSKKQEETRFETLVLNLFDRSINSDPAGSVADREKFKSPIQDEFREIATRLLKEIGTVIYDTKNIIPVTVPFRGKTGVSFYEYFTRLFKSVSDNTTSPDRDIEEISASIEGNPSNAYQLHCDLKDLTNLLKKEGTDLAKISDQIIEKLIHSTLSAITFEGTSIPRNLKLSLNGHLGDFLSSGHFLYTHTAICTKAIQDHESKLAKYFAGITEEARANTCPAQLLDIMHRLSTTGESSYTPTSTMRESLATLFSKIQNVADKAAMVVLNPELWQKSRDITLLDYVQVSHASDRRILYLILTCPENKMPAKDSSDRIEINEKFAQIAGRYRDIPKDSPAYEPAQILLGACTAKLAS